MSRRRHQHEEHENHERWLVSYADFITLLFAFFVVLYAISQVDLKKLSQAAKSFGNSFRGATDVEGKSNPMKVDEKAWRFAPIVPNVLREEPVDEVEMRKFKDVQRRLLAILASDGLDKGVKVGVEGRGLVVRIEAEAIFKGPWLDVSPRGNRLLDRLGAIVRTLRSPVVLSAKTVPRGARDLPRAFERSTARAAAVCRVLMDKQRLSPHMLYLAGRGEVGPAGKDEAGDVLELLVVRRSQANQLLARRG